VPTGRVKFYDPKKGFGYLAQDGGGADVHVRQDGLAAGVEGLSPGKRVEFDVIARPRGLDARSVRPVSSHSGTTSSAVTAPARLTTKELDALIADLIGLLDTTVLPELRRGQYPDRATSTQVTATLGTLADELEAAATATEPTRPVRAARTPARPARRGQTPPG
jgi:cold shock protein